MSPIYILIKMVTTFFVDTYFDKDSYLFVYICTTSFQNLNDGRWAQSELLCECEYKLK